MASSSSSSSSSSRGLGIVEALSAAHLFTEACMSENQKTKEKQLHALGILLLQTLRGADRALKSSSLRLFDPNIGDAGCEKVALLVFKLSQESGVRSEIDKLAKQYLPMHTRLHRRFSDVCNGKKTSGDPAAFFNETIASFGSISPPTIFLLRCHLLKMLRGRVSTREDGIVMTQTMASRLDRLSKHIICFKSRTSFIDRLQSDASAQCTTFIRHEAANLTSLTEEERSLCITMLSAEHCHLPIVKKFLPKTFTCLFYDVKVILMRLREIQALVALKTIVPSSVTVKPPYLFFMSPKPNEEFSPISSSVAISLFATAPIVVVEGTVKPTFPLRGESLAKAIEAIGFTQMILEGAAFENPYGKETTLEMVKHEMARAQIDKYRTARNADRDFFAVDHFCCSTLKEEGIVAAKK